MKNLYISKFHVLLASLICLNILISCGRDVNSVADPNFETDGSPLDSTISLFTPTRPTSAKLYVETSGSMNGFFRANKANNFKKTVWSVVSGLSDISQGIIYPMANGGEIESPISLNEFRTRMNSGNFVSNSSTQVPAMFNNIIENIDTTGNDVAILISDMKYSPMGNSAEAELIQYQEQIRNIIGTHPNISVSFVCAKSEFLNQDGSTAEPESPYYYIIIGKSENVADVRNDISRWCEATDSYIESGDIAMDYKTPSYSILEVKNGLLSSDYPKNLITTFDRELSDTCSFIIRVDMNGYPWKALASDSLKNCIKAKTVYGSSIDIEPLSGSDHIVDNHAYNNEFERQSYADFLVKLYNVALDDEVIEWTFSSRPFDVLLSNRFANIIGATQENDLTGSFSFNKFIEGGFNARLNKSSENPVRILVSSYQ